MQPKYILLFLAVALLCMPFPAGACDFCILSQGISPLDTQKGSGIRASERLTVLDRAYHGTDNLGDSGTKETYWTTELTGFYGVTEALTVLAVLPYKHSATAGELVVNPDMTVDNDPAARGSMSGIGDVTVMARYAFRKSEDELGTSVLAAVAGVKLPTGKTDGKTADGSAYLDSHLQMGTGSTDLLLGASYNRSLGRFSVGANLLGTITGKGEFGDTKHEFGNAVNYDIIGKYRVAPGIFSPQEPQYFIAFGVIGELRQREKEDGVSVPDSGGNTTYLSPGIQITLPPHWVMELSYQHAVYHNLYGTQMGEDFKTVGAVTYLF